jgi:hypothetical protein
MGIMGAHVINKGTLDTSICDSIYQQSALKPGTGTTYGTGSYAYYIDHVPQEFRNSPFVVFEPMPVRGCIELRQFIVPGIAPRGESPPLMRRFFLLPGVVGRPIKIAVLGFMNCPPHLPKYTGVVYYVH